MEFNGVGARPDQATPGAIHPHFVKDEGLRNFSSCAVMGATAGPPERGSQAGFVPRVFVLLLRRAEEAAHSSDPGSSGSCWTRPSTYPCSIFGDARHPEPGFLGSACRTLALPG